MSSTANVIPRNSCAFPAHLVCRQCQTSERHVIMKSARESEYVGNPLILFGEFQCGFYSIGACRPATHHLVIQVSWFQEPFCESYLKISLRLSIEIRVIDDIVFRQIVQYGILDIGVVVPIVQGACHIEEIDVSLPFTGKDRCSALY